jgi:hypothetical protein
MNKLLRRLNSIELLKEFKRALKELIESIHSVTTESEPGLLTSIKKRLSNVEAEVSYRLSLYDGDNKGEFADFTDISLLELNNEIQTKLATWIDPVLQTPQEDFKASATKAKRVYEEILRRMAERKKHEEFMRQFQLFQETNEGEFRSMSISELLSLCTDQMAIILDAVDLDRQTHRDIIESAKNDIDKISMEILRRMAMGKLP